MIPLTLPSRPLRILCVGAHADDLEIGCTGSVVRILAERPGSNVTWVVGSAQAGRRGEAQQSAEKLLAGAGESKITIHDFRDGYFPFEGGGVKDTVESLKESNPDLILTHWQGDAHQDHRLLGKLVRQSFRDHLIWEFEVPKYDGDLGNPNLYLPLPTEAVQAKLDHLVSAFPSQRSKHWFDVELFRGWMRLRGMECRSPSGYAEAFFATKLVLN